MKKSFMILSMLLLCATTTMAQEVADTIRTVNERVIIQPQHFGYFSYDAALKSMPEYAIAQQSIAELRSKYEAEMQRAEQDFTKKFNEFVSGQKSFPENIMFKRQKELQQLMEQSMAFREEAQELLKKAENDLMEPLHDSLRGAIDTIGTKHNFAYILNTDNNSYPFISHNGEAEDITEELTQLLQK